MNFAPIEADVVPPDGGHVAKDTPRERAVVAAAVFRKAGEEVRALLSPPDLYEPAHQSILRAVNELADANEAVDVQSVASLLLRKRQLERCGGEDYLLRLADSVPSPDALPTICRALAALARQRRVVDACRRIVADGTASCELPEQFLERSARRFEEACVVARSAETPRSIWDIGMGRIQELMEMRLAGVRPFGMAWPWKELNERTRGLLPKGVSLVVAASGAGKTIAGWQTARTVARQTYRDERCPILYVSGEMEGEDLWDNAMCSEAGVDLDYYYAHVDTDERFVGVHNELLKLPIFVRDRVGSATDINRAVREVNRELKANAADPKHPAALKLLVIDFVQMMALERAERNELALVQFSYAMKDLAKEHNLHVLLLAQENTQFDKEGKTSNGGIAGAAGLARPCDQVIFLRRPYLHMDGDPDRPRWETYAELKVTKGRRNSLSDTVVRIEPKHSRIVSATQVELALHEELRQNYSNGGKSRGRRYARRGSD